MKDGLAGLGSVSAAVLASLCCIGPLLALSLGFGSLGFFFAFEKYRVLLLVLAFSFLGAAHLLSYRQEKRACQRGESDCPPAKFRRRRLYLWGLTAVVIVAAFFPQLLLLIYD